MSTHKNSGFSIVEIVVAAAIITTIVGAAAGAFSLYLRLSGDNSDKTQAALLTEETSEALQFLRDQSWNQNINTIPLDTDTYIYWNGSRYETSETAPSQKYAVIINMSPVSRDLNSDISDFGTVDPRTRMVKISVSKPQATTTPILVTTMLLHDIYKN